MIKGWIIQDIAGPYSAVTLSKWTNRNSGDVKTSAGMMYWDRTSGSPHGAYWFSVYERAEEVLKEVIAQERHLHKVYVITTVFTFLMPVEQRLGWDHPMPKQQ